MQCLHPHIEGVVQLRRIHDVPLPFIEFQIQFCTYRYAVLLLCIRTDGSECTPESIVRRLFPEVPVFIIDFFHTGGRGNLLCQSFGNSLFQRLCKQFGIRAGNIDRHGRL